MVIKTNNIKVKSCKSEGLLRAYSQRDVLVLWHVCRSQLSGFGSQGD